MKKREFLIGGSLLGTASLLGQTSLHAAEGTPVRAGSVYNALDFGAKGEGKTPDSAALQKALEAAGAVGGTVYLPAGRYLCHDLKVHPHTTVLAEPQWGYRGDGGAVLLLDSDDADCLLNITGAFGAHLHGLFLRGRREGANRRLDSMRCREPISGLTPFRNGMAGCSSSARCCVTGRTWRYSPSPT